MGIILYEDLKGKVHKIIDIWTFFKAGEEYIFLSSYLIETRLNYKKIKWIIYKPEMRSKNELPY